jgi:hypothetical protein
MKPFEASGTNNNYLYSLSLPHTMNIDEVWKVFTEVYYVRVYLLFCLYYQLENILGMEEVW